MTDTMNKQQVTCQCNNGSMSLVAELHGQDYHFGAVHTYGCG